MEFWMAGLPAGRNPDSQGPRGAEAVHEVLELGSINLYMFHGGTTRLHEWLLSSGNARLLTGNFLWLWGFCSMNRAIWREGICHSKNDGDLLSEYHSKKYYQRVFARTNLAIGSQDQSFWESGQSGLRLRPLYPEKMEELATTG